MRHNARCSGEMRVGEESVEYLKPIMRHQADVEECRADGTGLSVKHGFAGLAPD